MAAGDGHIHSQNISTSGTSGFVIVPDGTPMFSTYGQLVATEPVADPCVIGHVVSSESIEYFDGLVVSNCQMCDERIMMARVPGGISTLKLKAFLGTVMGLELGDEDENFRLSDLLGLLNDLREEVAKEEAAIRRAHEMIDLGARKLQQRVDAANEEL